MDRYEFNAPKFVDFTIPENEVSDDFFGNFPTRMEVPLTNGTVVHELDAATICHTSPQRNGAADEEDNLVATLQQLCVSGRTPSARSARKSHPMITRLDVTEGRVLDFSQQEGEGDPGETAEAGPREPRPSPATSKTSLLLKRAREDRREEQPQKYVSMAEAVLKFQTKTPLRFRTKLQGDAQTWHGEGPRAPTVARTPHLTACTRVRPVDYPSREQREELEVAELSRHKIHAQPLDPHVFLPPKLGKRVPKFTHPAPFKLTEVKKKEPEEAPRYRFLAQPVPRGLLAPRCAPPVDSRPVLQAHRRAPHLRVFAAAVQENKGQNVLVKKEVFNFGVPVQVRKNTPLKRSTEVKPFSFEERDKEITRRKEERIKKVLEEERQARIFHAQPLPAGIRKQLVSSEVSVASTDNTSQACSEENRNPVFRAQPALVLRKQPFVPRKQQRSPLRARNVALKTEARSKERRQFDESVRSRLEQQEQVQREREERARLEAEAEAAAQRRLAESFRAQPVPRFKTPRRQLAYETRLTSHKSPFSRRNHSRPDAP
ncbi:targeting protein for Xklp2 homolog isoform X2 [Bacillus rossius redtenbacheri]